LTITAVCSKQDTVHTVELEVCPESTVTLKKSVRNCRLWKKHGL